MTNEADTVKVELPEAFITCTSANPDYFVTIKTKTLRDAHIWHDAVIALPASPSSLPDPGVAGLGIRICPKRDSPCPHGLACPYSIGEYWCRSNRGALKGGL